MRGYLGAGTQFGAGLGMTTQPYASDIAMTYDENRRVYVGEMTSRGGKYRVEGPNATSIDMQMNELLRYEYDAMMQEMVTRKNLAFGTGRAIMINGTPARTTQHKEGGVPVMVINSSDYREKEGLSLGNMLQIGEIIIAAISALQGQWMAAMMSAMSMAAEDYLAKMGSHKEEVLYAVSFGGILITAKTRSMLKKKLQFQKNKRIQLIMHHMRSHDKEREKAAGLGKEISGRLLDKKTTARSKWRDQVSPQGQEIGWRDRSLNMRKTLELKREKALTLWESRV